MTPQDIERIYEALAEGIDRAGENQAEIFLAKAALLLARETGDVDRALKLIADAAD